MESHERARLLKQQGKSLRQIAQELGVSKTTVQRWTGNIVRRSMDNPRWINLAGGNQGPIDAYGAIQTPDTEALLQLYYDTVYICASWLAESVSSTKWHLYVKTRQNQPRLRSLTGPILKSEHGADVREVLEHPLWDLIEHPNPEQSRADFLQYIDTQLSLVGNCYVRILKEEDGLPCHLLPLMTQYVHSAYDDNGKLAGYVYKIKSSEEFLRKEDVLHFKLMDPRNPYGPGFSPALAIYERVLLGKYELAYLSSLFRNQARPDCAILIKNGTTADQSERLQKEYNQRFRQGGIGGVFAIDADDMDVKPLNWNPKDVLGTELYKWTKLQIINAFSLNAAIWDQDSSNRAVATEARRMAQTYAVKPRLRVIEEKLNHYLIPYFDERFCVEFDSPVEEDRDFDLQLRTARVSEYTQLLDRGVYTTDEVRHWLQLPPLPKKPEENAQSDAITSGGASDLLPSTGTDTATGAADLRATVGGSTAVLAMQQAYFSRQITREAAVANAVLIFGFSEEEADRLFPPIPPDFGAPVAPVAPPEAPPAKSVQKCGGEGGTPGPCPEAAHDTPSGATSGSQGHDAPKDMPTADHLPEEAQSKLGKLWDAVKATGHAAAHPVDSVQKAGAIAKSYLYETYKTYGWSGTAAIMTAAVAAIPIPAPGASLVAAKAVQKFMDVVGWKNPQLAPTKAEQEELSEEEASKLGTALVEGYLQECGLGMDLLPLPKE